jgi:hypothetical protein
MYVYIIVYFLAGVFLITINSLFSNFFRPYEVFYKLISSIFQFMEISYSNSEYFYKGFVGQ